MKYYIIAGERSGDMHGANLIKEIKSKDQDAVIKGFGGDAMKNAGMDLSMHYKNVAFMGFLPVIFNLHKISKYLKKCKDEISSFNPDIVILIDYAGFNFRIAKYAKSKGFKVCYYITPKVWAWNQSRAKKIKAWVDLTCVILPFEVEFFKSYDVQATYVGNPVSDAVRDHTVNSNFIIDNDLDPSKKIIAILPGSRVQELRNLLPPMVSLANRFPDYQFVVAGVETLSSGLYQEAADHDNISIVYEQTYDLLANTHSAVVTSGTATLETALLNVPQVVVYKTNALSYAVGKVLVLNNIEHFSLVNLISGYSLVTELLQSQVNVETISKELVHINQGEGRQKVLSGYEKLHQVIGEVRASEKTAGLIIDYLKS